MAMNILGVILARAGSKGLPGKCMRDLHGKPVIAYTFEHARASRRMTDVVFSTDSAEAKALALHYNIQVVDRPEELATDTATVDDAARHAVAVWEARRHEGTKARREGAWEVRSSKFKDQREEQKTRKVDLIVLLYGNIPIRKAGLIDEAIEKLITTGASSVRSVAPVTKQHPDWIHKLEGDRMVQFRKNSIYRRQDLEPLYYHDGVVVVVTRDALFGALNTPDDKQSFLGSDRRAIVCDPEDAVDIDGPVDLAFAHAILQSRDRKGAGSGSSDEATARQSDAGGGELRVTGCGLRESGCVIIGDRTIGGSPRTYVIAEAGVNHDGDMEAALRLVEVAKEAGADAVKFQLFRAAELASASAPTAAYQRVHGQDTQRDMLAQLELSDENLVQIGRHCMSLNLDLIVTPFGLDDVRRISSLRTSNFELRTSLKALKLASPDLTNQPLIAAVCDTGLPLIVSTGASTEAEIRQAVEFIRAQSAGDRLVLLHCVSAYPTPLESLNLAAIATLARAFSVPVGLSDHTESVQTGGWATAAGACVLEKHFTLDRGRPGPDHAMSMSPAQLAEYIAQVRTAESALGGGQIGMNACESEVRRVARKSVVAAVAIPSGTCIAADMLTLKRPGTGIPPGELDALVGRRATVAIPADAMLSWTMVR